MQKLRLRNDPGLVEWLAAALADREPVVRCEAAAALGDVKHERALAALVAAVHDEAAPVQEAVIHSLERLGDASAARALVPVLLHGAPAVQWRAAHALKALQWRPATDAEEIQYHVALGNLSHVAVFGDAAVPAVSAMLRHDSYERRVAAVNALGEIAAASAVKPLQGALRDSDPLVRTAAAYALARVNDSQVVIGLLHALKDGDRNVRVAVAITLGKLGDLRAVDPLIQTLNDREWEVRAAALESLGRLGDPRAFKPVTERLDDQDQEVRQYAADAVAQVGDDTVLEKLVMTMVDSHSGVRQAAARALTRIDPYWDRSERVQRLLPDLQAAVRDKNSGVQFAAANLIKRITGRIASEGMLASGRSEAERKPPILPAVLRDLLRDRDEEIRLAAVETIARLELKTCLDALKLAGQDPNPWVRGAAQESLAVWAGTAR